MKKKQFMTKKKYSELLCKKFMNKNDYVEVKYIVEAYQMHNKLKRLLKECLELLEDFDKSYNPYVQEKTKGEYMETISEIKSVLAVTPNEVQK